MIHITVAPVDSGTASCADRPAVQKALLSERRKMRSGYRAQRRTDLLPQVHQSASKGGISMAILACLLIWDVGCRASVEAAFRQARLSVHFDTAWARSRVSWAFIYFHTRNLMLFPLFGCRHLRTIIGSVSAIMDSQQAPPVEDAPLAIDVRSAAFSVEERPNPLLWCLA
jgi:hypothetical protein